MFLNGFLAGLFLCLVSVDAKAATKFMHDFVPEKFVGKWWLIRVSERVFNNDEDCAHFVVTKKDGNVYDVLAEFHKARTDSVRKMDFDIVDREDEPAIYDLTVNGKKFVTAKILGTDYENWAVIYIEEGTYMIYTVASRTPKLEPQFQPQIDAIMKENHATATLEEINGSCPDSI